MYRYDAAQVLKSRRESRAAVADMVRGIRRGFPKSEGRDRVLRHMRSRGWQGCGTLGERQRVPGRCTPAALRAEGRALLSWSREPVEASYCGAEDAEAERKADAAAFGAALVRAARLVP